MRYGIDNDSNMGYIYIYNDIWFSQLETSIARNIQIKHHIITAIVLELVLCPPLQTNTPIISHHSGWVNQSYLSHYIPTISHYYTWLYTPFTHGGFNIPPWNTTYPLVAWDIPWSSKYQVHDTIPSVNKSILLMRDIYGQVNPDDAHEIPIYYG